MFRFVCILYLAYEFRVLDLAFGVFGLAVRGVDYGFESLGFRGFWFSGSSF